MHLKTRNVNTAFHDLVFAFTQDSIPGSISINRHDNLAPKATLYSCGIVKRPSRNGNVMMIDEPVLITYEKPLERVLFNSARDANPFFHLYEALWMLAGRNDVAPVAYYAKQMLEYSDDGKILNGAYGTRWRKSPTLRSKLMTEPCELGTELAQGKFPEVDQLKVIIDHLKADPTSRRAVLQMWNVEDDLLKIGSTCQRCGGPGCYACENPKAEPDDNGNCNQYPGEGGYNISKDVCCNLSVMFSLRDGPYNAPVGVPDNGCKYLDMTVTNRSNDMIWGLLGANYVHFSILQEYVAAHLGAEVGRYHHFSNNLHVYDWNWKPQEWLGCEEGEAQRTYHPDVQKVPLVKDPATFDAELPDFVERHSKDAFFTRYREPFLQNVAQYMCIAWHHYKKGDLAAAESAAMQIAADDWRIAALCWIRRRREKHSTTGVKAWPSVVGRSPWEDPNIPPGDRSGS